MMKVYEVLYLLNKELDFALQEYPKNSARFISNAYTNTANAIKAMFGVDARLKKGDLAALPITPHMREKLEKLLSAKINAAASKQLARTHLLNELTGIAGIGNAKADELIAAGVTNIKQLEQKKYSGLISSGARLMLKYRPLKKIPRELIAANEPKLTAFQPAAVTLVGGFIRKIPFSKDIDVMLVSDEPRIIVEYIQYLNTVYKTHVYAHGDDKASLLAKIGANYVKIDVFRSPKKYQHAMLLYAIGSRKFNIRMRGIAKRAGYTLNQYGLFKRPGLGQSAPDKPVSVRSERDFFKLLGMPYVEPERR